MTEQLADILAARIAALPLADRVVGLVRPYRHDVPNGEDAPRSITLPVPATFTVPECEATPRYLVPDENTATIFYFEDGGTVPTPNGWQSRLRLLGWVNPRYFAAPPTDVQMTAALHRALLIERRATEGPYVDLYVTMSALPADAALFSRYTDIPLLFPPYRVVGLELTCTYRLSSACAEQLPERITPAPLC
ncbi:hypothetical protein [Hymenobacter tenuis]